MWLLFMGLAHAQTQSRPITLEQLQSAQVQGQGGPQLVRLPHQLAADAFATKGSLVTFKLQVDLAEAPTQPVGIYVSKMALSGRLWINGHLHSGCEGGALPDMRC